MTTKHLPAVMAAGQKARPPDDFFQTPRSATVAMLRRFGHLLGPGPVWEPACGAGAMSRVLLEHGYPVISTNLADRGYGERGVDYLTAPPRPCAGVATNPPFALAEEFIRKAVVDAPVVAMLLKIDFWNAACRRPLFEETRPRFFAVLTWRLDFTGQRRPIMNCCWVIWTRGWDGPCETVLLTRPDEGIFA